MAERLMIYRARTARLLNHMEIAPVPPDRIANMCTELDMLHIDEQRTCSSTSKSPFEVHNVRKRLCWLRDNPPTPLLQLTAPPPTKRQRINVDRLQGVKKGRPRSSMSNRSADLDERLNRRCARYPCAPYTQFTDRGIAKR
jgi:hypothetical protein